MLVLDEAGKIAEQGTWQQLKDQGSTIQEFVSRTSERATKPEEKKEVATDLPLADPIMEAEELPSNRQYGDTTIYFYYTRIIGYWRSALFVFFLMAYVFLISFPGKLGFYRQTNTSERTRNANTYKVSGFNGGPKTHILQRGWAIG